MSVNEAVMQLEFKSSDIIMFRNADDDEINVVYRRSDGSIGYLEPEY